MDADTRRTRAAELRLCFNCLAKGHLANTRKLGKCRTCKRNHHSLLHIEQPPQTKTPED